MQQKANKQPNLKMGRGSEQKFFQRRHTDGQQVHEKMLHVAYHHRNEKQNFSEISLHTCQNGTTKRQKILLTSADGNGKKREPSLTVYGDTNDTVTMKNSMEISQKN